MRQPVTRRDQVAPNIRKFPGELVGSSDLQTRLGHVHAWYALRDEEAGWIFAPSKFVGYPDNTARKYLESYNDEADGRQTERALAAWFAPVKAGSAVERELMEALTAFLAPWGRVPRKGTRISVVSNDATPGGNVRRGDDEPLMDRITIDPLVCGGRPCIRGTRVRVSDIVDMLAHGVTSAEILDDYPYLDADDIAAALAYAARAIDHRVIRAA